ncbi:DNA-directed RNA polymerase I subunit RPA49-like [Pomacea canaliculata]|uniref:DNA-directed RNA polymerase I subunit RPA49-like n=1 Tax=Pomacea canaliculata TaxID=400727 RepID=UPI000D738344|nr:DNA-directed RNA polymerase I subunit RPA49-like [Pomacea canaliculata]
MSPETLSVQKVTGVTAPLVCFANGSISEACKKQLRVSVYEESKQTLKGRKRKIVMAESQRQTYKASNFDNVDSKCDDTDLYLAEVNKETGEMSFYSAEVFHLMPVREESILEQSLKSSMSYQEKTDLLTESFGSGKQKKALARRQQIRLKDSVIKSAISSVVDSAVAAQELSSSSSALPATTSAIPPYNIDARTPAEVYKLDDIIGQAELQSLRNVAEVFFQCNSQIVAEWQTNNTYFSSVLSRLSNLPFNETARWESACCLMYLQFMMTLFQMKAAQMQKKDPLPADWPDLVTNLMLNRFTFKSDTAKSRRCLPARLKDLLLSHILVLCLILDRFTTDLELLQVDLKIGPNKLQTHVKSLGCKVKKEASSGSFTAILTVPLVFPEAKKSKKVRL